MKESELKSLIKEVVRECVKESGTNVRKAGELNKNLIKPASTSYALPKGKAPFPAPPQPPKQSPLTKEAGLTSEDDMDHGYDEAEEIRLIKGLHLITSKLIDMHLGEESGGGGESEDVTDEIPVDLDNSSDNDDPSGEEDVGQEPEDDDNERSPEELNESKKKKTKKKAVKKSHKRKALAKRFKKGLEEVKKITEFFISEASYKVVSPNETDTAKEDKARKIQTEPKVTEAAFKTQARSARTIKDLPQNPKNVADKDVPQV
jgi:hypothetical protein